MDIYTHKHFQNVARNMNMYLMASAYDYYPGRDRISVGYEPAFFSPGIGMGNRFGGGLYSVGFSNGLANIGYRLSDFIGSFL